MPLTNPTTGTRKTTRQKRIEEDPIVFRFRLEPALYERIRVSVVQNQNPLID